MTSYLRQPEPPLDPPEATVIAWCAHCSESIEEGEDYIYVATDNAAVHEDCFYDYAAEAMRIEYKDGSIALE